MKKHTRSRNPPKILPKKTLHAKKRAHVKSRVSKAKKKQEFIYHCKEAIRNIGILNDGLMPVEENINVFTDVIFHLEKCLESRPGNHLLRKQHDLCLTLKSERTPESYEKNFTQIPIFFRPELF